MNNTWQLHVARRRLSELVDTALLYGTQIITRNGNPVAKVVPLEGAGMSEASHLQSLERFLLNAPRGDVLTPLRRHTGRKKFSFEESL